MHLLTFILIATTLVSNSVSETVTTSQDGIDVQVTINPTKIIVGDSVNLYIQATTEFGTTLSLENTSSFGSFTVVDSHNLLDIPTNNSRQWNWSMKLDTFDAATTSLSGMVLNWTKVSGDSGSITIEAVPIEIISVAGDTLNDMTIRDIKGSVDIMEKSWWGTAAGIGIVATLILIATIRYRKRKIPARSPYEQAISALAALKVSNAEVQQFYISLSDVLRRYIEGRFNIAATGQTTREFLNAAKQNPHLEHSDRTSLGSFLVAADLVKFALHEPSSEVTCDAIVQAELFIQETSEERNSEKVEVAA